MSDGEPTEDNRGTAGRVNAEKRERERHAEVVMGVWMAVSVTWKER
jgi:hypothetical protein